MKVKLVMSTCGTCKSKASGAKQTTETNNLNYKYKRVKNSSWLETNQLAIGVVEDLNSGLSAED